MMVLYINSKWCHINTRIIFGHGSFEGEGKNLSWPLSFFFGSVKLKSEMKNRGLNLTGADLARAQWINGPMRLSGFSKCTSSLPLQCCCLTDRRRPSHRLHRCRAFRKSPSTETAAAGLPQAHPKHQKYLTLVVTKFVGYSLPVVHGSPQLAPRVPRCHGRSPSLLSCLAALLQVRPPLPVTSEQANSAFSRKSKGCCSAEWFFPGVRRWSRGLRTNHNQRSVLRQRVAGAPEAGQHDLVVPNLAIGR